MTADIIRMGKTIDVEKLDVNTRFRQLLLAGHAMKIYKTSEPVGEMKAVSVLDSYESVFSPHAYELGYGRDRFSTDRAIVRALYTYSHARRAKRKVARSYAEATHGRIDPELREPTKLDVIVEASDREDGVILRPIGDTVEVLSFIGGGDDGQERLTVHADTALGAIRELASQFNFYQLGIRRLEDGTKVETLPDTLLA